jgi:hypothetical protein
MDEFTPGETQAPIIAGDAADKDAAVLNSQVQQNATPPGPDEEPSETVMPLDTPRPASRMLTQSIKMICGANGWTPFLVLPADPRRTGLRIRIMSDTAVDRIRIADDPGKLESESSSALVYVADICSLDSHTGPLWAYGPDATGPVTLSVIAVSE